MIKQSFVIIHDHNTFAIFQAGQTDYVTQIGILGMMTSYEENFQIMTHYTWSFGFIWSSIHLDFRRISLY